MTQDQPYPQGEGKVKWVSTEWLEDHLDDDMTILDVQPNIHDYIVEHVPGAIFLNEEFLRCSLRGMCNVFQTAEGVQEYFRRVGVTRGKPALVYTGVGPVKKIGDGLEQTMMAYGLVRYGHDKVYVLNGGLEKWKKENRPLSKDFPKRETSDFKAEVQEDYPIKYDEFKRIKDRDDIVVLDARPPEVYEGQGVWRKPGHIPGAINLPWRSLMAPDNTRLLKPEAEIKALIEKVGATKDKTILCSCGTGREATNEFILFKWYFGYPKIRLHEGAFTEWTAYPVNPTVTGKSPR